MIKEQEEESEKVEFLEAPEEKKIKELGDFLEELGKEENPAPGEKVIKEQGDDSGGRIQRGDKMGAVGDDLNKVVADALEHLIEEHDYTDRRTWVNEGNLEKEGGVVKQESNEDWEDPSRWQFVTVNKSKEVVGSKFVDKLEVGQEVKMSAHVDKGAEEIVPSFLLSPSLPFLTPILNSWYDPHLTAGAANNTVRLSNMVGRLLYL